MALTSLSQLPELGGRFLQLADGFKPKPFYNNRFFDFQQYCYQGGSSGPGGLWLALLMARTAYVDSLHRVADVAAALGADQQGYLDGTGTPDIPAVAYFAHSSGLALVLAFQGTTAVSQWLSYVFAADQVAADLLDGRIFEPFRTYADPIWARVRPFLNGFSDNCQVLCVGHSLGGAIAEIVGRRIKRTGPQKCAGVFTFGGPRVGNRSFADVRGLWIDRVVLEGDPVTNLPPQVLRRQLIGGDLGRAGPALPVRYNHSNCTRHLVSVAHKPERDEYGPKYDVFDLAQTQLAMSLDGVSERHGSFAYEHALIPWVDDRMRGTEWFTAALSASADMGMSTGY